MPGGDGTGPAGMGPMTGRAAGYCAGYSVAGFANPIPGRGFWGRGRGGGFGGGRRFYGGAFGWRRFGAAVPFYGGAVPYGPATPADELEALKSQAKYFEEALSDIKNRITELEVEAQK